MPVNIGFKLNRLYDVSYVAADLATSFVAVVLESTQANPICVYGVDFFIVFPSAADRNSFVQHEVQCVRNIKLLDTIAAAGQIPAGTERVWGMTSDQAGLPVSFDDPMQLEPGYTYTFILFPALFDPALAGTARVGLTVRGDMLPWVRPEENPVELRTGTSEEQPGYTKIAES